MIKVCQYCLVPSLILHLVHPTTLIDVPVEVEATTKQVSGTLGSFHLIYSASLIQLFPAPVSIKASIFSPFTLIGTIALFSPLPITTSSSVHLEVSLFPSHSLCSSSASVWSGLPSVSISANVSVSQSSTSDCSTSSSSISEIDTGSFFTTTTGTVFVAVLALVFVLETVVLGICVVPTFFFTVPVSMTHWYGSRTTH